MRVISISIKVRNFLCILSNVEKVNRFKETFDRQNGRIQTVHLSNY